MRLATSQIVAGVLTCLIAGGTTTIAQTAAPIRYELSNGLHVILRPIQGAQQTAVVTLFAVGGDHDPEGASGMAHLVEHAYVTAAAGNVPIRTTEEFMRAYPLGWNAQTGDDYTVFATVVASQVDAEIRLHAQRMGQLQITQADLRRELPRMEQELANMFGRIPFLAAPNLARERVRPAPHGGRKGGRMEHLSRVSLPQLQARWQKYYQPRNAIFVVAGAFQAKDVRTAIDTAFGALPPGDVAPPPHPPDTVEDTRPETVEVMGMPVELPSAAALTFRAPAASSPDYPPFLVLYSRLLMQRPPVVFNRVSPAPTVSYAALDDPSVLSIVAALRPDESLEQVEARLRQFVETASAAPWQEGEPTLTKQNVAYFLGTIPLPDALLARNVYGVAFSLGRRQQLRLDGGALSKKLDGVTATDLERVVRGHFSPRHGVVVAVRIKSAAPRDSSE